MNELILKNIYLDILEISDINKQKEYWLGKDLNHVSSFVEVYSRLFDDNQFDKFVDGEAALLGFSNKIISALRLLREKLNKYEEKETDEAIIADNKWLDVVECAKTVISIWDETAKEYSFKSSS